MHTQFSSAGSLRQLGVANGCTTTGKKTIGGRRMGKIPNVLFAATTRDDHVCHQTSDFRQRERKREKKIRGPRKK
jgi:ribosomal protein L25 (general stress protein Ctc)